MRTNNNVRTKSATTTRFEVRPPRGRIASPPCAPGAARRLLDILIIYRLIIIIAGDSSQPTYLPICLPTYVRTFPPPIAAYLPLCLPTYLPLRQVAGDDVPQRAPGSRTRRPRAAELLLTERFALGQRVETWRQMRTYVRTCVQAYVRTKLC